MSKHWIFFCLCLLLHHWVRDKLFTSWSMGWAVEVNKKRSEKDYISHIHNISAWVNSKNIPLMNIIGKYSRLNKNIIMYKRNLCFALPYIARRVEGCIYRRRGIMQILSSVLWSKFTLLFQFSWSIVKNIWNIWNPNVILYYYYIKIGRFKTSRFTIILKHSR